MIPVVMSGLLAAERRKALLAEAEADRQVRQARLSRRVHGGAGSLLVRIRPIRRSDAAMIRTGFTRLSPESRRLRFLAPKHELTVAEVRYFTEVDHHDHEALVAVSRLTGKGLGVARYIRNPGDPASADIAVTVLDQWQGRGVGTALLARLSQRAQCEGILRFTALMSADNIRARRLLRRLPGAVTLVDRDAGTVAYEISLVTPVTSRRPRRIQLSGQSVAGCA